MSKAVQVTQVLVGLGDDPIRATDSEGKPMSVLLTLRNICVGALISPKNNTDATSAEEKTFHRDLARLIYTTEFVEFGIKELIELKKLINTAYTHPLIVAGAFDLLDSKVQPNKQEQTSDTAAK